MKRYKRILPVAIIAIAVVVAIIIGISVYNSGQDTQVATGANPSESLENASGDNGISPGIDQAVDTSDEQDSQDEDINPEPQVINLTAWTTDRVNLRTQPTTESESLGLIDRRTQLTEVSDFGEWMQVEVDGKTGFISAEYLTTEEPTTNGILICIDPGHQGQGDSTPEPNGPGSSSTKARVTSGTRGTTTGVPEYKLNLEIGLKLRDELEARGYEVCMTRESHDVNISNMERAQYATGMGADITIRIHANGADGSSTNGALMIIPSSSNPYVSGLAGESSRLATAVLNGYCSATGMKNLGNQVSDTMTGINWCTMPVCILEMGFMTNPSDDTNMQDSAYQSNMVRGIADGVDAYYGI